MKKKRLGPNPVASLAAGCGNLPDFYSPLAQSVNLHRHHFTPTGQVLSSRTSVLVSGLGYNRWGQCKKEAASIWGEPDRCLCLIPMAPGPSLGRTVPIVAQEGDNVNTYCKNQAQWVGFTMQP